MTPVTVAQRVQLETDDLATFDRTMADYATRTDIHDLMKGYTDMYGRQARGLSGGIPMPRTGSLLPNPAVDHCHAPDVAADMSRPSMVGILQSGGPCLRQPKTS